MDVRNGGPSAEPAISPAPALLAGTAACGGSSTGTASSGSTPSGWPPVSTAQAAPLVKTAQATVDGKPATILTDDKGMTLHYFTADKGGKVTCTGRCSAVWSPLKPSGMTRPAGGPGVTGTLATVANPEGGAGRGRPGPVQLPV